MNVNRRRVRNLETNSVVIFDDDLKLSDDFQRNLIALIDYVVVLNTEDDVRNFIQQHQYDFIVLIISAEFGENIIKHTHNLRQLHQVYIHNPPNTIVPWAKDYEKVNDR
jgi:hypothetical protein